MILYDCKQYMEDVERIATLDYNWEKLTDKTVAISGGTGMIGSFLVDVFIYRTERFNQNIGVYVLGRNREKAEKRFGNNRVQDNLRFFCRDINKPVEDLCLPAADYIIHAASNTHPMAYAGDPVGTIAANVMGTDNLLRWAAAVNCKRFVFLSSVEIYGENRGDTDKFAEDYMGYIDCNTLRAGYPESKRTGEAICQAYRKQEGMDIVIPRLSRTYGPTMLASDTKAISQFIKKGVSGEDIVLKSEGTQLYSYCYVADAASATVKLLLDGENGQVYNVASHSSDFMLKELAHMIAEYAGSRVQFELPDTLECAGYSKATKAVLDTSRLKGLGWTSLYDMQTGLKRTMDIMRSMA
ncbi:MAG: NAD-dependent epimerase/dehydratase family protein [Clostridium sp.]|nr:NAD-dependent epimerase/dehydratase family protein [Clostridium sp.]MCM1399811.1 NAD-dependent epimerase/dehydratase family protein [Clostridium sp.]MCM1459562.1 NAD-dependent epimerase/dehydratase family protein [Bacteroides sp.]